MTMADLFDRTSPEQPRLRRVLRLVFPAVFLIYLVQTASGVVTYTDGFRTVLGLAILVPFGVCYLLAMTAGRLGSYRVFWWYYAVLLAITALELPFARQDASIMLLYVAVLTVAARFLRATPVLIGFVAFAIWFPALVPSWHTGPDYGDGIAIAIVSLAMFGFFSVLRSNDALAKARTEVARLATENERARIARDLHDLLGHSLTTITVKAALANRLSGVDPARAAVEIAEVEALTRSTLADVRAAVSGYREVTLGSELAAAREVLRAAGITAQLPGAIDEVQQADSELFAWVVREGVTNVVRHSRARHCEVRLGDRFVEICDDGIGGTHVVGNGLTGLRERVGSFGGNLIVGPDPVVGSTAGWRLRVEIPA